MALQVFAFLGLPRPFQRLHMMMRSAVSESLTASALNKRWQACFAMLLQCVAWLYDRPYLTARPDLLERRAYPRLPATARHCLLALRAPRRHRIFLRRATQDDSAELALYVGFLASARACRLRPNLANLANLANHGRTDIMRYALAAMRCSVLLSCLSPGWGRAAGFRNIRNPASRSLPGLVLLGPDKRAVL
jgi:hypothetical protein